MTNKPQLIILGFILLIVVVFLTVRGIIRWNGMEEIFSEIQRIEMSNSTYAKDNCTRINDSILSQEHNFNRLKTILVNSYESGMGGKKGSSFQSRFHFNFFTSSKEFEMDISYYGKDLPSSIGVSWKGISIA